MGNSRKKGFSVSEKSGILAFALAFLLAFADIRLAVIPLTVFVLLCLSAPFFPSLPFFLPVISRGKSGKKAVSLTFDDGPDPFSTPDLLNLLSRHGVRAAFFINGKKAASHPELIREILARGHSLGNHSYSHDNLLMLKSGEYLEEEIEKTQQILGHFGIRTYAFRPPVGITNPRLRDTLKKRGMYALNFSCRGPDAGNRRIRKLAERILRKIRPDDIVLLHDVRPFPENKTDDWLREIDRLLYGLRAKGFSVLPLEELTGKKVMADNGSRNP